MIFGVVFFLTFACSFDFKRFFFFSELVWLSLFILILGFNIVLNNPLLYVSAMFILVFTAIEAVVIASVLLISSSNDLHTKYSKNDSL